MGNAFVPTLRHLYKTDENVRKILDYVINLPNRPGITLIDEILRITGTSRRNVVPLMRTIARMGMGDYLEGRHGGKARIEWYENIDVREYAKSARPVKREKVARVGASTLPVSPEVTKDEPTEVVPTVEAKASKELVANPDNYAYLFPLRPSLTAEVTVPFNITRAEVERLCRFLQSLPIE